MKSSDFQQLLNVSCGQYKFCFSSPLCPTRSTEAVHSGHLEDMWDLCTFNFISIVDVIYFQKYLRITYIHCDSDLERFASLCLNFLNQGIILAQGIVWLSDQGRKEIKFSVDTLVPSECGFTNTYHPLNNRRNGMHLWVIITVNPKWELGVCNNSGRPP